MRPIRLLIVEDDASFVAALMAMLKPEPRIEVIGHAANGVEAVAGVERLVPDVVTMDLDMPVLDGVEATRILRRWRPRVPIIIVTGSRSGGRVEEALALGAFTHVEKAKVWSDLIPAVLSAGRDRT